MPFDPSRRILEPEIHETAPAEETVPLMRDLVRINSLFGGRLVLRDVFRPLVKAGEEFSVLDIGAASGDMARCLRRYYPNAWVVSLDARREYVRPADPPRLAADAFHLPFPARSFDFVLCSLFLHHFREDDILRLLSSFLSTARRAAIVVDLERSALAFHFIPATRWAFRWHPGTIHDARISVQSGFVPAELEALARRSGAASVRVRRYWPWSRIAAVLVP